MLSLQRLLLLTFCTTSIATVLNTYRDRPSQVSHTFIVLPLREVIAPNAGTYCTSSGDFVRIGPRTMLCSSNKAGERVYASNAGCTNINQRFPFRSLTIIIDSQIITLYNITLAKRVPFKTPFTSTDETFHAKLWRFVSNAIISLLQFEHLLDSTTVELLKQLTQRFADKANGADVANPNAWLIYYAFIVTCEPTYSKRMCSIDRRKDVEQIMSNLEQLFNYAAVVSLDRSR